MEIDLRSRVEGWNSGPVRGRRRFDHCLSCFRMPTADRQSQLRRSYRFPQDCNRLYVALQTLIHWGCEARALETLEWACERKYSHVVELLIKAGAIIEPHHLEAALGRGPWGERCSVRCITAMARRAPRYGNAMATAVRSRIDDHVRALLSLGFPPLSRRRCERLDSECQALMAIRRRTVLDRRNALVAALTVALPNLPPELSAIVARFCG